MRENDYTKLELELASKEDLVEYCFKLQEDAIKLRNSIDVLRKSVENAVKEVNETENKYKRWDDNWHCSYCKERNLSPMECPNCR